MSITLHQIEQEMKDSLKKDIPEFRVGDTIKVTYKIIDGDKERLHAMEGFVIKMQNAMNRRAFTIRRFSGGVGMEITFPLYSPLIDSISIAQKPKRSPRRARLFYVRKRIGKQALEV